MDPGGEVSPTGQAVQVLAATMEKVLAGQVVHTAAPGSEYFPPTQLVHTMAPVSPSKVPAAHAVHDVPVKLLVGWATERCWRE